MEANLQNIYKYNNTFNLINFHATKYSYSQGPSTKNWFGPVKDYSLLDQTTSRNLSTSSEKYDI